MITHFTMTIRYPIMWLIYLLIREQQQFNANLICLNCMSLNLIKWHKKLSVFFHSVPTLFFVRTAIRGIVYPFLVDTVNDREPLFIANRFPNGKMSVSVCIYKKGTIHLMQSPYLLNQLKKISIKKVSSSLYLNTLVHQSLNHQVFPWHIHVEIILVKRYWFSYN